MNAREPEEQDLVNALYVARVAIRAKHAVAANTEINNKLPQIEKNIRRMIAQGKAWRMLPESLKVVEDA